MIAGKKVYYQIIFALLTKGLTIDLQDDLQSTYTMLICSHLHFAIVSGWYL